MNSDNISNLSTSIAPEATGAQAVPAPIDDELARLVKEFLGSEDEEDLAEPAAPSAYDQLQAMVGLERVKREIDEARTVAWFNHKRSEMHLDTATENRHHMLFLGNPGTGKTTVAQLVGEMYHDMGLLSKGHTVQTDRTKLIGEYIGETEVRFNEAIEQARGGVLFIDEAYTLLSSETDSRDYGRHVLNALLPVLSDPNPDILIILAGYEDKMKRMLTYNQGLLDRFPLKLHFDDYTAEELWQMAQAMLYDHHYALTDAADALLHTAMERAVARRDSHFGNGRWVHNFVLHGIIPAMARRVMAEQPSRNLMLKFSQVEAVDVEAAMSHFQAESNTVVMRQRAVGFTA